MKRKLKFGLFILLSLFIITGCNKKTEDVTNQTPQKEEEIKEISIIDMNSNTRPYAVIVNNYPSAVKVQSGLDKAYLIYEFPIEGGLSRSLAFFKDIEDVKVGTVRSARQYHIDYVLENDAIFVHFGWNHPAEDKEIKLNIDYIDGNSRDGSVFYRERHENLATEHTVYTNLANVISYATNTRKYRTTSDVKPPFKYSYDEINLNTYNDSIVANNVKVTYSGSYNASFTYDATTKRYLRYYNGRPHTDYFTKEHYSTKNIILTEIPAGTVSGYADAAGNNYLDLKHIGSGTGYYITNGFARKITWSKASMSEQTKYMYEDGTEINVNDGNTYVEIYPRSDLISIN